MPTNYFSVKNKLSIGEMAYESQLFILAEKEEVRGTTRKLMVMEDWSSRRCSRSFKSYFIIATRMAT